MASRQCFESPGGRRRLCGWVGVGLLLLFASGCGGPRNEAVSGSVKWKGQPLEQGTMEFVPADGQGEPVSAAIVNGRYQLLSTPGLALGAYQVRISSRKGSRPLQPGIPDADMGDPTVKEQLPPEYNLQTTLKADVKKGGNNVFDFDLP